MACGTRGSLVLEGHQKQVAESRKLGEYQREGEYKQVDTSDHLSAKSIKDDIEAQIKVALDATLTELKVSVTPPDTRYIK